MSSQRASLNIETQGDDDVLPSEFRLFVAGWNASEKGDFLFDEQAAASVMEAYARWGVELAIDLEHQMMLEGAPTDPDARDARGWFELELREDGSLWAVNVRWTEDGAARLTQKRQRYISPAFTFDSETRRVEQIVNAALTSIPATHGAPALLAATPNGTAGDSTMTHPADLLKKTKDALTSGDTDAAIALLDELEAALAERVEDDEETAPKAIADDPNADAAQDATGEPSPNRKPKAKPVALQRALGLLTGKASTEEALAEVTAWKHSHIALERERAKLSADRETLEAAERRRLYGRLMIEGGWVPTMVWADAKANRPKPFLAKMPLEQLNAFVADVVASTPLGRRLGQGPRPAVGGGLAGSPEHSREDVDLTAKEYMTDLGPVMLTSRELRFCDEAGAKPEVYARNKAARDHARRGRDQ